MRTPRRRSVLKLRGCTEHKYENTDTKEIRKHTQNKYKNSMKKSTQRVKEEADCITDVSGHMANLEAGPGHVGSVASPRSPIEEQIRVKSQKLKVRITKCSKASPFCI